MKTLLAFLFVAIATLAGNTFAQNVLMPTSDRMFSISGQLQPDGRSYEIELILVEPTTRAVLARPRLIVEIAKEASVRIDDPVTGLSGTLAVIVANVDGLMTATAELKRGTQVLRSERIVMSLSRNS
jgi:hypothetical protein